MRKKILLAVMALLVMATGKIWAAEAEEGGTTTDGSTAYVVLCNDNSLHFLCSNETLAVSGTLSIDGPIISNVWSVAEVLTTGAENPGWQSNNSSVTSVVIDASFENARPMSCYGWFKELSNECKTIEGIEYLNTSKVTSMSYMFSDCSGLTSLDLRSFDTSNVTDMTSMFYGCSSLTSLDLSRFDTSKVTSMSYMFSRCSSLKSLDLSRFDTSKVTSMSYMFSRCSSLKSLDLSNFVTSSVKNMSYMFYVCSSLTSLDFSNFDTSSVTNMNNMFYGCSSLKSLDLSNFVTSSVKNMSYMFYGCSSLTSLDFSNFDTSNVTDMTSMFYDCSSLKSLDLSNFVTSNVTSMSYMFYKSSSLTSLDLSSFDTSSVTFMNSMFYGCSSLKSLDLSNFVTSNVTNMNNMFYGCSSLTSLDLSRFDTSKVTSMSYMFYGCSSLSLLDLSKAENSDDPTKKTISDMIGTLPDNVYPVIYVLAGTTVTGGRKNVINGDKCESLLIDANNLISLNIPYSFTAESVTFKRSFAAGKAHTICLPFAISSATADYKLYEYDAYKDGIVKFKDAPSTTTTPHKPYLLVPNTEVAGITVENATIISTTTSEAAAAEEEGFFGVYKKMNFTAEVLGGDYDYYGWTGNTDGKGEFRKAGEGAYVNACRAYIKLKKVNGNNAPARLSIDLGDGTTGISIAKSDANGGMDAPVYNLQGQRVSGSYKGVVIKNGKKMIVK